MSEQTNKFLLYWDCNGLEACVDVTADYQDIIFEMLCNRRSASQKLNHIITMFEMRSRYNIQRHYELYVVDTTSDITAESLTQQFNDHPQAMADLIRERGKKIFSHRRAEKDVII